LFVERFCKLKSWTLFIEPFAWTAPKFPPRDFRGRSTEGGTKVVFFLQNKYAGADFSGIQRILLSLSGFNPVADAAQPRVCPIFRL